MEKQLTFMKLSSTELNDKKNAEKSMFNFKNYMG
jgi:hypothetical protein